MSSFPGFSKELYTFLKELAANNEREWFNANKDRYTELAKEPSLQFILAIEDRLAKISPSYIADPRTNGGSMFRIYRDTRFSKDKRPYKENIGFQFRHAAGKDAHAPGFYIHLQPNDNFAGGGIWLPPTQVLSKIRNAIDTKQREWLEVKKFIGKSDHIDFLEGERLKKTPKGFDPDHPLSDDLRLKTFFAGRSFKNSEVTSPQFIDGIDETFHDLVPLMRFINVALGHSF